MRRLIRPSVYDGLRGFCPGFRYISAVCVLAIIFSTSVLQVNATASTEVIVEDEVLEETVENEVVEEVVDDGVSDDSNTSLDGSDAVSGGDLAGQDTSEDEMDSSSSADESEAYNEILALLTAGDSQEQVVVFTDKNEFLASPATVSRYEYEILNRLEFLQYSQTILIGLIFILIFKKK